MKFKLLIGCLLLLSASCVRKQSTDAAPTLSETDFPIRTAVIDSKQFNFRIYVPKDASPNEHLPVMLYLHGSDERGSDNQSQLGGVAQLIQANPQSSHFIVVFPQCQENRFWDKKMIEAAMTELDQTVKEFSADESRLYLVGFSLGGYGAWTTAAMYPNKFAAIVPMSGRLLPRPGERKDVDPQILALADQADPFAAFATKISKTPVWIFHGANDPVVPVDNSRRMAIALKKAGNGYARYTELESTGHVSLNAAFSDPKFFEWLMEQRLKVIEPRSFFEGSQAQTSMHSFSKF